MVPFRTIRNLAFLALLGVFSMTHQSTVRADTNFSCSSVTPVEYYYGSYPTGRFPLVYLDGCTADCTTLESQCFEYCLYEEYSHSPHPGGNMALCNRYNENEGDWYGQCQCECLWYDDCNYWS
jgi:hypothetical protein